MKSCQAYREKLQRWREFAGRFPCVASQAREGELSPDYTPEDLAARCSRACLSSTTQRVHRFLLHLWDPKTYRFELVDVALLTPCQREILTDWVTGKATGQACQYF